MKRQQTFVKSLVSILSITFMISTTRAEIPFTEARGIYIATKEEYEPISPFWAMVAVHGRLLERIRFFGFYKKTGLYDKPIEKKDNIAQLLFRLFPSPDGVQLVPNADEEHLVGKLSKNLPVINDIIAILLSTETKKNKAAKIRTILDRLGSPKPKTMGAGEFADILANAYEQEKKGDPHYPKNIVIISLLSFFVKVADTQEQLFDGLPLLFKPKSEIAKYPPYNTKEYVQNKKQVEESLTAMLQDPNKLELLFCTTKGFETYERSVSEPLTYRKDIFIQGANHTFPDCGETALRNFIMLLLSVGNGGVVPQKNLALLEDKIRPTSGIDLTTYNPYIQFTTFIKSNPDITQGSSKDIHNAWAEVVSKLNGNKDATELNDIQYGNSLSTGTDAALVYEIKSNFSRMEVRGIVNMFNVIARIIPDEALNEVWSSNLSERYKQVARKLDRLCELFSREDVVVGWKNQSDPEINSDFLTIIFTINTTNALKWQFRDGHFQVDRINGDQEDWRAKLSYFPKFPNEWIASLFPRSANMLQEADYAKFFPMAVIYNPSLRMLEGIKTTIGIVLHKRAETFYPLINRWVEHSIYADNPSFLVDITDFVINLPTVLIDGQERKTIIDEAINSIIEAANREKMLEQNIVALALNSKKPDAAKVFIDHKANPNANDARGNSPLHLAILQDNMEILNMLIANKANLEASNQDQQSPLFMAAVIGNLKAVRILLEKGATAKTTSINGRTPIMSIVEKEDINPTNEQEYIEIIKLLIRSGVNINAEDSWNGTYEDYINSKSNTKILEFLREQ